MDIAGRRRRRSKRGQSCGIQPRHICYIVKIYKFRQVTIFDAVFCPHVLVLMVVIFAIFGKADSGEALLIESAVVTAAQVAVTTEDQLGTKGPKIIGFTDGMNITRQLS